MKKLQPIIQKAVMAEVKAKGYAMVLSSSSVIYLASKTSDITPAVLKRVNKARF